MQEKLGIVGGGVQQKKEREKNLKEEEQPERSLPLRIGGVQGDSIQKGSIHKETISMYQGRTGWRRATLTGKPLTGAYNETLRRRAGITAKREQFERGGVAQIGMGGDEIALPG